MNFTNFVLSRVLIIENRSAIRDDLTPTPFESMSKGFEYLRFDCDEVLNRQILSYSPKDIVFNNKLLNKIEINDTFCSKHFLLPKNIKIKCPAF